MGLEAPLEHIIRQLPPAQVRVGRLLFDAVAAEQLVFNYLQVIGFFDLGQGLFNAVGGEVALLEFTGDLLPAPALHFEASPREGAGEALLVQVLILNQITDHDLGGFTVIAQLMQLLASILVAAILVGTVLLQRIEGLLKSMDYFFFL